MDKSQIRNVILEIFISHLKLDKNYFSRYTDNGDNLYIFKDLGCDQISRFEILEKIEKKCGILIGDADIIWGDDLTIGEYIESIYKHIKKDK